MKEFLPISLDELKSYAKSPAPDNWTGAGMQLQSHNKKQITYGFVVDFADEGERSVGMVSFDKTNEPRWYEKDGHIRQVTDTRWEQSIVMHDEEGMPTFGSYGLTMAGLLKVCKEIADNPMQHVIIRTDETNGPALGLFAKMGLEAYPEYNESVGKGGVRELIPTSGRVVDTTLEQMYAGIKNYHRSNSENETEEISDKTKIPSVIMKRMMNGGR